MEHGQPDYDSIEPDKPDYDYIEVSKSDYDYIEQPSLSTGSPSSTYNLLIVLCYIENTLLIWFINICYIWWFLLLYSLFLSLIVVIFGNNKIIYWYTKTINGPHLSTVFLCKP